MTPQERYERDPLFRTLVDMLHHQIRECRLTPTETREAAMLAQIHYEQTTIRPILLSMEQEEMADAYNQSVDSLRAIATRRLGGRQ